jgi:potassium efflux system protein
MLSPEKIKEKIKDTESDKELEQGLKNKLLGQYRNAINSIEMATAYDFYALSYTQSLKSAPAEEEKVNRLLQEMDVKPKTLSTKDLARFSTADQERRYVIIQAELASLKEEELIMDELLLEQRARPSQIKEALVGARKVLQEIDEELKNLRISRENPLIVEARLIALQAARQARTKEIVMLNRELFSYGPRIQLLTAKRELASRKLAMAQLQAKPFEEEIEEKIKVESEKSKAASALAENIKSEKHPAIRKIAEESIRLGQEITAASEGVQQALASREAAQAILKKVEQDFYDTKQKIQVAGFSKTLGHMLLEQLWNLPDVKHYSKENKKLEKKIKDIWLSNIKADELSRYLSDLDREVRRVIIETGTAETAREKLSETESEIRDLLKEQKMLLGKLSDTNVSYLSAMGDLEITQKQLIGVIEQYRSFMESRVLWIPNAQPFGKSESVDFARVVRDIFSLSRLTEVAKIYAMDMKQNPGLMLFSLIVFIVLFWSRKRFRSLIAVIGGKVSNPSTDNFLLTIQALFFSIILAIPEPLLLGFIGWRLQDALDATEFIRAIGKAFTSVGLVFFYMQILYFLCLKNGIAELHFQWDGKALKFLRKEIKWYSVIFLPSTFFIAVSWFIPEAERGRAGRFVFVTAMLALAAIIVRMLKPRGGLLRKHIASYPRGCLSRLKYLWYPSAIAVPLTLAGLAVWGYIYTSITLAGYTFLSFWLIVGAVVANNLVIRWITVTNRKLALKQAEAVAREKNNSQTKEAVLEEAYTLDVPAVSVQTRKLLNAFIGIGVIIGLLIIWSKVFPALSVLDQVSLWQHTVVIGGKEIQQSITLSNIALVIVLIIVTALFTWNIPGVLEIALLLYTPVSAGSRYAIAHLSRYIIVVACLISVFQVLGGKWSQIQWLVAALGVGLGFGLQEIFGNLISGIIILFERPIRIGDTVTIGDVTGTVFRINMRATTITDWDNKELIIPNKSFITGQLVNWTRTDAVTRVTFKVGVAYGSDTRLAHQTILDAVKSNPLVLKTPGPLVSLLDFGESSMNFTVFAYAKQLSDRLTIIHELHIDIEKALREKGITIPFPQRDVHVLSHLQ